jgi:hypothetical protein
MADDSRFPNIGGNGFIWILLVAAGTYFVTHTIPLEGSRPASTERSIYERVGEQRVDARLWQDPFAAVADYLAKSPELKPQNCDPDDRRYREIETYCRPPLARGPAPVLTLLVSVSGTPYSEDQEARRRRRYAVLAGLDAEGFVPEDPQHIGFYWPDANPSTAVTIRFAASPPDWRMPQVPASPPSSAVRLPKVVPYEWFRPRPEGAKSETRYQRILLLWFDEDTLAANAPTAIAQAASAPATSPRPAPLQQFAKLLCPYLSQRTDEPPSAKVKILGPHLSTTLKAVVDEVNTWAKAGDWSSGICPGSVPPPFYVSDATVSDATLIPDYVRGARSSSSCQTSETCLRDFFHAKGIELYRLIATDEALARTIRSELVLRGVDQQNTPSKSSLVAKLDATFTWLAATVRDGLDLPKIDESHHIALISEWDTLYGRALPDAMARCLGQPECKQNTAEPFPQWLHVYKYLRGLDGQMPNVEGAGSADTPRNNGNKQDKDSKDNAKSRPDLRAQDRAEGQSQFDYLHRLGDHIQQLDKELHRNNQRGIEAVGVLGSDVYDKLLVLQALRPLLPNAWFFTTDLDALLLHPSAQTLTRNLLVASSFGLQLKPALQGEIPPFRISYQTAQFFATRVAIHGDGQPKTNWLKDPLLFEIGSSRAFQFAPRSDGGSHETDGQGLAGIAAQGPSASEAAGCEINNCEQIHPSPSEMVPQMGTRSKIGLVGLGLVIALGMYLSFRSLRGRTWNVVHAFMGDATRARALMARGVAILIIIGVVIFLLGKSLYLRVPQIGDWLTQDGQPMTLLEGISVWPTVFLRLATLLLCVRFLFLGWRQLEENLEKIIQDLNLAATWEHVQNQRADVVGQGRPWIRLARRFGYCLPDNVGADHDAKVAGFWRKYIYQGRWIARIGRVTAGVAAMAVLWWILVLIFGHSHDPIRGEISFLAYKIVTLALIVAVLVLIFFVADATFLCWWVIRACRMETAVWPRTTLREFGRRFRLPQASLDDWIDLVFIAKRTKCVTTLFYYPFLIIALIIVSRSALFANYAPSIPDLVSMGIGLLVVTACAVALRWSAEESRAKARRRLNEQIILARHLNDEGRRAGQLETLLGRVEELREGAFSPFSQQPLVRAMLLPLGGFGGTALLQYLMLPGLS